MKVEVEIPMHQHDAIGTQMGAPKGTGFSWREEIIVRALSGSLRGEHIVGRLRLTLPSGRTEVFGSSGPQAEIALGSFDPLWRGVTRGALGVTECYLDGDIATPDLGAALRFCLANSRALASVGGGILKTRAVDRLWHWRRANTKAGSRRNIKAHYDLGNEFYRLWLDPSMTYSSALFTAEAQSLETAQHAKNAAIIEALALTPGDRVLEIGCGWGGFAQAAAERGAQVTGITLSAEQLAWARTRLAAAGLGDRTTIAFTDYRDVTGTFDKIASVEMIEAVGEENWPAYFRTLHDRLRPGGTVVLQAITIEDKHFAAYRREPDFIQRYIFPGGMLPTISRMEAEAARAGLSFETVMRFGDGYARTLALWRDAFRQAWPHIAAQGFDERFRRMWDYYLTYCEVGFENRDIDVGLYRLKRQD
jgi:cyclopropane-fatty-acyl-phospholipid synthase